MTTTGTSTGASLSRGAIGLREVLFQSVTSMAAAGAVALSIAAGATYPGGALPLAVLLGLITMVLGGYLVGSITNSEFGARHPERLPDIKRVFADDVIPSTETVTSK